MDRIFTLNVPHILQMIFLQLQPSDYLACLQVCKSWKHFLEVEVIKPVDSERRQFLQNTAVKDWLDGGIGYAELTLSQRPQWHYYQFRDSDLDPMIFPCGSSKKPVSFKGTYT